MTTNTVYPKLAQLIAELRSEEAELRLGGGEAAAERQRSKGRLTVRERLALLLDPGTPWLEFGLWSGWEMYQAWGGAPAAGVVCGIGTIACR